MRSIKPLKSEWQKPSLRRLTLTEEQRTEILAPPCASEPPRAARR